jgi:hypothetical protein
LIHIPTLRLTSEWVNAWRRALGLRLNEPWTAGYPDLLRIMYPPDE